MPVASRLSYACQDDAGQVRAGPAPERGASAPRWGGLSRKGDRLLPCLQIGPPRSRATPKRTTEAACPVPCLTALTESPPCRRLSYAGGAALLRASAR